MGNKCFVVEILPSLLIVICASFRCENYFRIVTNKKEIDEEKKQLEQIAKAFDKGKVPKR